MVESIEINGADESLHYALRSALLMRANEPTLAMVREALELTRELCSEGAPATPLGFLTDVVAIARGEDASPTLDPHRPGGKSLWRRYDDYVLGRLYGDRLLQRGGDALAAYQGRDGRRADAYLLQRVCERARIPQVWLNPAALKPDANDEQLQDAISREWDLLTRDGLPDDLGRQIESLCECFRAVGEVLGVEDVFELERGLALRPLAQRVAWRHAWQAAEFIREVLPLNRPPIRRVGRSVATRVEDEDRYPVGGYASLSNRGTMESLLHSQLAFMDDAESPDLFDLKLVRDELLYFARDENTFYRRRKLIVVSLDDSLDNERVKDPQLTWQRLSMLNGILLAGVKTLQNWLSDHALQWIIALPENPSSLSEEQELFRTVFTDEIEHQTVQIIREPQALLSRRIQQAHRSSEVHLLFVGSGDAAATSPATPDPPPPFDSQSRLLLGKRPLLEIDGALVEFDVEHDHEAWRRTAVELLLHWI